MSTVFVLGAGTSQVYGYPSGLRLVEIIKEQLDRSKDHSDSSALRALNDRDPDSIDQFVAEFTQYADSIKGLIAQILFEKELAEHKDVNRNEDFYSFFCREVPVEEFKNYKIITFNYDRCFEHRLTRYLLPACKYDAAAVYERRLELEIIHMYGRLPALPGENDSTLMRQGYDQLDYGHGSAGYGHKKVIDEGTSLQHTTSLNNDMERQRRLIREWGKREFKTVYENQKENGDASKIIREANRIFFLGFGYHPLNMRALSPEWQERRQRQIMGTCYQVPFIKRAELSGSFPAISFHDLTAMGLFREACSFKNKKIRKAHLR